MDPQQINLYANARNNPLNVVDPDGENTITVENQTYSFLVEKRDGDLLKRVKVTVTETTRTERDDDVERGLSAPNGSHWSASTRIRNAALNSAPGSTRCSPRPLVRALVGAVIGSSAT